MTHTNTRIKSLIKLAAKILNQNRWVRGDWKVKRRDGVTAYCAVGALQEARSRGHYSESEFDDALDMLNEEVRKTGSRGLMHYNDSIAKSKQRVIDLFKKALEGI